MPISVIRGWVVNDLLAMFSDVEVWVIVLVLVFGISYSTLNSYYVFSSQVLIDGANIDVRKVSEVFSERPLS